MQGFAFLLDLTGFQMYPRRKHCVSTAADKRVVTHYSLRRSSVLSLFRTIVPSCRRAIDLSCRRAVVLFIQSKIFHHGLGLFYTFL